MKVLTEDIKLKVKIEEEIGEEITTDTGVPHGVSALLFMLHPVSQAFMQNSQQKTKSIHQAKTEHPH